MIKKIYKITDMNCASCATLIQIDLEDAGYNCRCSYANSELEIEGKHDFKKIVEIVKKSGYTVI